MGSRTLLLLADAAPPETRTTIWILGVACSVLAAIVVALLAVVWSRIMKRPEEVHEAATAGDNTLSKRIEHISNAVQKIAVDLAVVKKSTRTWVRDQYELRGHVQENRDDIALLSGAVGVIQNHLDLTPIPIAKRPRRPQVIFTEPVDADDDDNGSTGGNGS